MAAEPMSASLVKSLSLPGNQPAPQGYYRSRLFSIPFSTNPLVAAAAPLFSLLERISLSPTLPAINNLRDSIEHELHAFNSRLIDKNSDELDALATYLMCATIDELLGKSCLRVHGDASEFRAFTPLSYDGIGPEQRFFDIVYHIKEQPNQYLDLIELAYYCLIAGFEGQQHQRANGRMELDNLIEELFQLIQQYRVNQPHQLFRKQRKMDVSPTNYKRWMILGGICAGLFVSVLSASYLVLENKVKTVQFSHTVLAKLDD